MSDLLRVVNELGQPVGHDVELELPVARPARSVMEGQWARLEPLDLDRHGADLFATYSAASAEAWTYLPYGPFTDEAVFREWLGGMVGLDDPMFFVVLVQGRAVGVASYLRVTPWAASIEVGHIHFSPALQRTPAATEAMALMMGHVFDLGYRRYEWKCDALNGPSRAAASRLGFSFEGIFRQATMYKGRNRDTAWFSILDSEWPAQKAAFDRWLDPLNFDESGEQRLPLRLADSGVG